MAIPSGMEWEFRQNASAGNSGGGGFVIIGAGTGIDYSKQDSPQFSLTGALTVAANSAILHASASTDMTNNVAHIVSGSNFTAGWYHIVKIIGTSIIVDRNCTTAAGSGGVVFIGGAMSLNSVLDDDIFEAMNSGNTVWIGSGTYVLGEPVSTTLAGTFISPINVYGYFASRGDNPNGNNRPLISCGANAFTAGNFWNFRHIRFDGTSATGFSSGLSSFNVNIKSTNSSTTSGRNSTTVGGSSVNWNLESISQNGNAFSTASLGCRYIGCYAHDSTVGFTMGSTDIGLFFCLAASIKNIGISAPSNRLTSINTTLYGYQATPRGSGITISNAVENACIFNNIIYGFATGVAQLASQRSDNLSAYTDIFNVTNSGGFFALDSSNTFVDPGFNISELSGGTATTSANFLYQSGVSFASVDTTHYLHIHTGAGIAAGTGIYLITAINGTALTVNNSIGSSSNGNASWTIRIGNNFSIGANVMNVGFPGSISGSSSIGYLDLGALQANTSAASSISGSGGSFIIF